MRHAHRGTNLKGFWLHVSSACSKAHACALFFFPRKIKQGTCTWLVCINGRAIVSVSPKLQKEQLKLRNCSSAPKLKCTCHEQWNGKKELEFFFATNIVECSTYFLGRQNTPNSLDKKIKSMLQNTFKNSFFEHWFYFIFRALGRAWKPVNFTRVNPSQVYNTGDMSNTIVYFPLINPMFGWNCIFSSVILETGHAICGTWARSGSRVQRFSAGLWPEEKSGGRRLPRGFYCERALAAQGWPRWTPTAAADEPRCHCDARRRWRPPSAMTQAPWCRRRSRGRSGG